MSARINIADFETTPLARLELIRHGTGKDFKYVGDRQTQREFLSAGECDLISIDDDHKLDRLTALREMRLLVKRLTGMNLKDLVHEANNGTSGLDPDRTALKEGIRSHIYRALPFLKIYAEGHEFKGLEQLSREANALFDKVRSNRCYKNMQELDMINEIRNCDDPSTLLLWAFDDRVSDDEEETIKYRRRKRFEALRKLLIMLDLSEAKDDSDPEIDHKTALEELTSFLYERIIYRDKLKRLHLDANCDRNGNAIDAKFVDAIDGNATGDRRTRKLLARKMHQTLNGKDVYVITDDRIKGSGDLVVKAYDANDYIANRDVDRNGQLFVFGSRKEWEHCFDQFIPELIDDIATNTQKKADKSSQTPGEELPELKALRASQLVRVRELKEDGSLGEIYGMFLSITPIEGGEIQCKNPKAFFSNIAVKAGKPAYSKEYEQYKDSILRTIVIYDEKDNLEGQNEFRASRKAGSSKLAVLKFKIEIRGSDTKKEVRHYEFQIYLPKGFANSKFSLRDSWESYSIKRANKVGRAFWPEDIYEVDHAQAQSDAFSGLEQELGFKLEQEDCNDELACQSIGGNSVDLYAAQ